ncbi:Patatin [Thermocrinis albus DSM 14484]|uniref:Patatin n=1 Tax=Thermocrinis albus (strain DSM 14484 / JCM 11386 / HI 11/12) TaxID=638303 RepID=D3SL00_THEAH|nr:patatin-like phospholipase family protein [Thermocrinis albus]ADC89430.1 Patatin [Thermocrinis albus DSM 14484]
MEVYLILSGGAIRGVAHIGVLKALQELGFRIKGVSGVSAGALVGAYHCAGYSPKEMLKLIKDREWVSYIRPHIPRYGLFSLRKAEVFLRKTLGVDTFEALSTPLVVCALDINTGSTLYFSSGELIPPLLGSCALPGIFEPMRYRHYYLVDGGITNNLPVEPFVGKGTLVAVDVNPLKFSGKPRNVIQILLRSFFLSVRSNTDKRKEVCHIVIEPDLQGYPLYDIRKVDEIYMLGYTKAMEKLKDYAS